ncbi:MAG TPA: hypothetical protein VGN00_14285 [Puia sp.]|jgi:hypothetical protein
MPTKNKKDKPKRIFGVDVSRNDVKEAANLEAFKKANPNIFDHLPAHQEDEAYKELAAEGYIIAPAAAPAKVPPAASASANSNS